MEQKNRKHIPHNKADCSFGTKKTEGWIPKKQNLIRGSLIDIQEQQQIAAVMQMVRQAFSMAKS